MLERQRQFEKDGYVIVRQLLPPHEVQAAIEEIGSIIAGAAPNAERIMIQIEPGVESGKSGADQEPVVRKLMSYVPHSEALTRLAEAPCIREVLRELIGEDVKLLQDMALLKPPFVGSRKTWHQDCAYFPIDPPNVVGFWIALDPATPENGCMQVMPGTHREPLPHEQIPQETFSDFGVRPSHPVFSECKRVAIPLDPGDALVFHGLTMHGTEPNRSPHRRRALQLHYMDARCRYTGRNEQPAFRRILGRSYEGCV